MIIIDMNGFGSVVNLKRRYLGLEEGKQDAINAGLEAAVLAGKVKVVFENSRLQSYNSNNYRYDVFIEEAYLKGFFGPVARKIGIDLFMKNVSVNDLAMLGPYTMYTSCAEGFVQTYLESEKIRLIKTKLEKERKENTATWTKPTQLLIPDIGTVIRLTKDWTFRLYFESRNVKVCQCIGVGTPSWSASNKVFDLTIKAGTEMTVDRVYIRKGADDYSSLTFTIKKDQKIKTVYNGQEFETSGRFWAKLSDVNKMEVEIDTASLSEN